MANNKNSQQDEQTLAPTNELEQLRQIVFGKAEQQLHEQISTLRNDMEQAFKAHSNNVSSQISTLQDTTNQQFLEIEKRLQFIDKTHDDNEASIQKNVAQLASEHDMFTATTQQDFKDLTASLENESNTLAVDFNDKLEQLTTHLEEVSKELSSSKTDRKTLARLLATMATNLEDESS